MAKRGRPKKVKPEIKYVVESAINTDATAAMRRIAENAQTEADVILIGQKIAGFKQSDMWPILQAIIDIVIKDKLTRGKDVGGSSDDLLGYMRGANAVMDVVNAYGAEGRARENQLKERQRMREEEAQEDGEDVAPEVVTKPNVGI